MKNTHPVDRWLRMAAAIGLAQGAYFWFDGAVQWGAYSLALLFGLSAALAYSPSYILLGIRTAKTGHRKMRKTWRALALVSLLVLLVGGSCGSAFLSRQWFLEGFNGMNHHYKQSLFLTGKNEGEQAIAAYNRLMSAWVHFNHKYASYRPYALHRDRQLSADLVTVGGMLAAVDPWVRNGELHKAHLELEKVRPVFQDLLRRNGLSMLSVALMDFHDSMALMLAAAKAQNKASIMGLYTAVSDKLQAVEAQANDSGVQAMRQHLDALNRLAQDGHPEALAAEGDRLKSSFIQVYLQRG